MCAFRDNLIVSPVSMAWSYRLDQKPRRPVMKKLERQRKNSKISEADIKTAVEEEDAVRLAREASIIALEDEDFDFDDDYDDDTVLPEDVDLTQRYYVMACKDLKIRRIKIIYDGLVLEKLRCKGMVLSKKDMKACTIALLSNSSIEVLEFDNNEIGPDASVYFGDVFARNNYLTEIRITWNGIGKPGAEAICRSLYKNNTVRVLDLTGNRLCEDSAEYFETLMSENSTLYELYLGHNYFREKGGKHLAEGIAQNDFLRVLDLSWNHLRLEGAKAIGQAIGKNINLEVLNVSWNGFYIHGITHLAASLVKNQALLDLDLSCNRLSETCIAQFLSGLEKNSTLKKLRIARNHITHTGVIVLLQHLEKHPKITVEYIDLGDQHVQEEFVELLKKLQETRTLEVKHGVVWSRDRDPIGKNDATEDELALLNENPHYVLMEFMKLQKLRLVDLFHQMDTDKSKGISVKEFQDGLQAVDIPLKLKTLEKFVIACDTDKNGEIDFSELMEANRQYKEELRTLARSSKPLEQTNIGRIQKLLRKIMLNKQGRPVEKQSSTGEQQ
ncbi:hypothetical protein ACF0H5_011285 [Mactra antiquata]